jgi:hypothetical protein
MKPPKVQNWAVLLRVGAEDYRNSRRFSTKSEKMNLTLNTTAMTPRARIVTQVLSPVPFLFAATSCRESRSGRRQACANAGVHGRKSKSSTAVESELAGAYFQFLSVSSTDATSIG